MDSDLSESIAAFKAALHALSLPATFGQGDPSRLRALKERFHLPRRYLDFLAECDPLEVETRTPAEQVQLHPSSALVREQREFCLNDSGQLITTPTRSGWRPAWFVIAIGQLGDPYFLDTSKADAEGDCPVLTAMSGADSWKPRLCASSFATFLSVLAATMDVATGFNLDDYDPDNERVFREAVAEAIREVDPASLKAGHWT